MKIKPQKVIVTRKLPKPIEERMKELFDVYLNKASQPISKTELIHCLREADILVPTLGDHITSQLLSEAGPNLKLIANYGAGFDHIDIQAALQRNILVSNTPDVLSNDTADMTMALILGVPRRMAKGSSLIAQGEWHGWSPTNLLGTRISGKRLGILGMGRIGLAVAKRAQSFGLEIHYHNRRRLHIDNEKIVNAKFWDNLDEMLRTIDILTIHVPHTPSTFHLMNARRLNLLGKSAFIINTARGEIIDGPGLEKALENGIIGGAALDVAPIEPLPAESPLWKFENCVMTPHTAGASQHRGRRNLERFCRNLLALREGRPFEGVVDKKAGF